MPGKEQAKEELKKLVEKYHAKKSEIANEEQVCTTAERQRIDDEIKKTDAEIDELVYKLYGITGAEKKIIEESLK